MRVFLWVNLQKREGRVYNRQLEKRSKAAEGALGIALSRQCSPNWHRTVKSVHPGGWDSLIGFSLSQETWNHSATLTPYMDCC